MRDNFYTPAASLSLGLGLGLSLTSGTAGFMRLSASCPSLNQLQDGNEASNQLGIATGHTNLSTTGDAFGILSLQSKILHNIHYTPNNKKTI